MTSRIVVSAVAGTDFFDLAFGLREEDQERLHGKVMSALLEEVHGWDDEVEEDRWIRRASS